MDDLLRHTRHMWRYWTRRDWPKQYIAEHHAHVKKRTDDGGNSPQLFGREFKASLRSESDRFGPTGIAYLLALSAILHRPITPGVSLLMLGGAAMVVNRLDENHDALRKLRATPGVSPSSVDKLLVLPCTLAIALPIVTVGAIAWKALAHHPRAASTVQWTATALVLLVEYTSNQLVGLV